MTETTRTLSVRIARFVDDGFPGWVECDFADAEAHHHAIVDKVPAFTSDVLDATGSYPREGTMACRVLEEWRDDQGRELVRITTRPYGIGSTEGLSEFVVLRAQIVSAT